MDLLEKVVGNTLQLKSTGKNFLSRTLGEQALRLTVSKKRSPGNLQASAQHRNSFK